MSPTGVSVARVGFMPWSGIPLPCATGWIGKMQGFAPLQPSDREIDQVVAYLRHMAGRRPRMMGSGPLPRRGASIFRYPGPWSFRVSSATCAREHLESSVFNVVGSSSAVRSLRRLPHAPRQGQFGATAASVAGHQIHAELRRRWTITFRCF